MKKYLDLEDVSNVNCSSVLSVIKESGEISRKGISDATGLSWAGMTKIVNKLFEKGYLEENKSKAASAGVGRIPNLIRISQDRNMVIGLDINRQGLVGKVINLAGEIQEGYASELNSSSKEELLNEILEFTSGIVEYHKEQKILAISVAMQGQVDVETGVSMVFPHCKDWVDVPIKEILQQKFGCKVYVEHDPNCMLYASINGKDINNCILFRIDKSIGMAAYVDGKIMRGNGLLEVKNCILDPGGKECRYTRRGSLESYVCGCTVNDEYNEKGVEEFLPLFSNFMYNMAHLFHSKKIILTGDFIKYRKYFEYVLQDLFDQILNGEEIEIIYEEEVEKVAYGAALIGVQAAIEEVMI